MSMDTRQKLANTHEMYLPKIIELLDMGETSLQKVKIFFFSIKPKNCCSVFTFHSYIIKNRIHN
jgi:hypothetical protein